MSGVVKPQGELIAWPRVDVRADPCAASIDLSGADLHNVVPFLRPRDAHHAPQVVLPADAARPAAPRLVRERAQLAAFVMLSLAVHAGLFTLFWREPDPLASIGVEAISVEIVIGANAPAGAAQTPGEQELQEAAKATDPQPTEPQREAEEKATEQPQNVQVARAETAPEQTTMLERQADEAQPEDSKVAPREELKPSVAMVQSPTAEMPTAAPRETLPDTMEMSLLPQPEQKPVEKKPEPVKNAAPAPERRRIEAPTKEHAAKQAKATPAAPANNVGVGRSDPDSNYKGLVSAHLRRYQQSPSGARSGEEGAPTVTFSLDGGGRVTSVRLVRGSGIASFDAEAQAMVRRASPFPAAPSGRPHDFTQTIRFRVN